MFNVTWVDVAAVMAWSSLDCGFAKVQLSDNRGTIYSLVHITLIIASRQLPYITFAFCMSRSKGSTVL